MGRVGSHYWWHIPGFAQYSDMIVYFKDRLKGMDVKDLRVNHKGFLICLRLL